MRSGGLWKTNVQFKTEDKMENKSKNLVQSPPFCKTDVMRSCSFCQFFQHEEIGDSDFGGVYAENPSCSKYYDTDKETEEDIPNFDRNIERDCCKLDFWRVIEVDNGLAKKLAIEQNKYDGSFSETYELFKVRYNYA